MKHTTLWETLSAFNDVSSGLAKPHVSFIRENNGLYFIKKPSAPEGFVDLGLSVKWAKCNLGAETETDQGDHYAWGEIETKSDYSWGNYKYTNGTYSFIDNKKVFTKYVPTNNTEYWNGTGDPDNLTTLESVDDVATVNYGENWRMPTEEELNELLTLPHSSTTKMGVDGWEFIGNGNTLFIPATDYNSTYWSSTLVSTMPSSAAALNLEWNMITSIERAEGLSIRPVFLA